MPSTDAGQPGDPVRVRCRGDWHQVGVLDGVLALYDHEDAELRREQLLRTMGGPSPGCFAVHDAWTGGPARLPRALVAQLREVERRVRQHDTDWLLDGLARGTVDPRMRGVHGWSLLHLAMWVDHDRVLPVLFAAGLEVDTRDAVGRTPLHVAVVHRAPVTFVRRLLELGADPDATGVDGTSPRRAAARTPDHRRRWDAAQP